MAASGLSCSTRDLCYLLRGLSLRYPDSPVVAQGLQSPWARLVALRYVGDLSSLTKDQTRIPWIARWMLNPWTTKEVPQTSSFNEMGCHVGLWIVREHHQFSSVTQSCPTLCDPRDWGRTKLNCSFFLPGIALIAWEGWHAFLDAHIRQDHGLQSSKAVGSGRPVLPQVPAEI